MIPPPRQKAAAQGSAFAGAILGQILFGLLGDLLGIRKAVVLALLLAFTGAMSSAFVTWGTPDQVYKILAVSRFVIGTGVGGLYSEAERDHLARVHSMFNSYSSGVMMI